jgi:hypothetical protein
VLALAAGAPWGGCLIYHVATAPVKVAVGAAEVAGTVAVGTVKVAGSVAGGAIKLAAGLAQAGAVTFVDAANHDHVSRVPWRQGMTLADASAAASVQVAQRPVEVVRGGQVVYATATGGGLKGATPVAPGDVVQVGR